MDDPTARAREIYTDKLIDEIFEEVEPPTPLEKIVSLYESDLAAFWVDSGEILIGDRVEFTAEVFSSLKLIAGHESCPHARKVAVESIGEAVLNAAVQYGERIK